MTKKKKITDGVYYQTPSGNYYTRTGNEVKFYGKKPPAAKMMREKDPAQFPANIDVSKLTLDDYYNPKNNVLFSKWNPTPYPDALIQLEEGKYKSAVGTWICLIDIDTEDEYQTELFRNNLGEVMEYLMVFAILGTNVEDKTHRNYRFATLNGIDILFEHYAELLEQEKNEPVKRRLSYVAGLIRGYCSVKAYNGQKMLEYANKITLDDLENEER